MKIENGQVRFTDAELFTISRALDVASEVYASDKKTSADLPRVAERFSLQETEARELHEKLSAHIGC